ncbi:MAG: ABC transporter ATP-binding protein [Steroidobacteraceae bacterium]|jgi:cobalt/nickel transport system ATP-binding protein|nr:ABC transporter ATP-binding protein [Steroidobacteraceae bacterium]
MSSERALSTTEPLLRARDLVASRGARRVLDGAALELHEGERLVVLGENGAGKSTLLMALLGLLPGVAGEVEIFGRPCRTEADFAPNRGPVGLLFQDPDDQLFCATVAEDAAFGPLNRGATPEAAARAAHAALGALGIARLADRPPHALSGGEKRLAALAGVLAMRPRVLLLDEPTASLEAGATTRVLEALLGTGLPLVVATHDPACDAALGTRRLRLADGRCREA